MRAAFAIAALAGAAIAAPSYGYGQPKEEVKNVHVVVETVVETVYVTEGYEVPKPTPAPQPVYEAPAQPTTTVVYEQPKPEAPQPQYPTYEQPKPTPTPEAPKPSTPASPPSSNTGYMAIVDEYRGKMGMKQLAYDSKLESNAKNTVDSSNGQMIHKLNPGSMGQVLAMGGPSEFKHVFVGGWLCEVPSVLKGSSGECATESQGWNYQGQDGHAKILSDPSYSKIGCACSQNVWSCDVA